MKKWIFALLVMMGVSSFASAQQLGVRVGYPGVLGVQYTDLGTFGSASALRALVFFPLFRGVYGQVDFLYRPRIDSRNSLFAYLGGGPHFGVGFGGGFALGAQGTAGLEFLLPESDVSLFGDFSLGFDVSLTGGGVDVFYNFGFGANFRLR